MAEDGSVVLRVEADEQPLLQTLCALDTLCSQALSTLDGPAAGLGERLAAALLAGSEGLRAGADALFGTLAASLEQQSAALQTGAQSLIQRTTSALFAGREGFAQAGQGLFSALCERLEEPAQAFCSAAASACARAAAAVESLRERFSCAGASLLQGLWEGFSSLTGWLSSRVSSWAQGLIGSVESLFGIHSPSRVMAGVGENLALGLGEGWQRAFPGVAGRVQDTLRQLTDLPELSGLAGALKSAAQSGGTDALSAAGAQEQLRAARSEALRQSVSAADSAAPHTTNIRFEGSLAQLGRVLRPVLDGEARRAGTRLTGGV